MPLCHVIVTRWKLYTLESMNPNTNVQPSFRTKSLRDRPLSSHALYINRQLQTSNRHLGLNSHLDASTSPPIT